MAKDLLAVTLAFVALMTSTGCRSAALSAPTPQYIVTSTPITVFENFKICVAIDPADPNGVWFWGAGHPSGCSSRSTFAAEGATGIKALDHARDGSVQRRGVSSSLVRFRVPMHPPPEFVDVDLVFQPGQVLCVSTGSKVSTTLRSNLDIPMF
jgi:hypothetical protein